MSLNVRYMSEPDVAQPMAPRTTEQCGEPIVLVCFLKIHFVCDEGILPYLYFLYFLYYLTLAAYQSPTIKKITVFFLLTCLF